MISTIERLRERGVSEWADTSGFTEAKVKVHTAGYGSAPLMSKVPAEDLASILEGAREVNTTLSIRVSGYGSRNVSVRVLPVEAHASTEGPRDVRLRIPGYGYAPTTMSFARA